ncbi:hypothetical protein CEXT_431841 [Caerostris extrusa]|uniref:Uncharacterized protein n=1 Tax=Caerostris extrusa TaxID=172846 RepID=A0AAV4TDW6_CAEEX|nr:hypothetical protein CEXT_431841 [Caerostris extrusa]
MAGDCSSMCQGEDILFFENQNPQFWKEEKMALEENDGVFLYFPALLRLRPVLFEFILAEKDQYFDDERLKSAADCTHCSSNLLFLLSGGSSFGHIYPFSGDACIAEIESERNTTFSTRKDEHYSRFDSLTSICRSISNMPVVLRNVAAETGSFAIRSSSEVSGSSNRNALRCSHMKNQYLRIRINLLTKGLPASPIHQASNGTVR